MATIEPDQDEQRFEGWMRELDDGRWLASCETSDAEGNVTPAGQPFEWPLMAHQIHATGTHASYRRAYCQDCALVPTTAAREQVEPARTECEFDPDHLYSQCATPDWHK